MQGLAQSLNMSQTTLYYATQFYNRWPELCNAFQSFTGGKEISWFMIVKKYLPKPKKEVITLPEGKWDVFYADPPWNYRLEMFPMHWKHL